MRLKDFPLPPLPRVAYCIVARSAEQAEALPLPSHLVSQNIHMVAVVLPHPKFCVTYTASVPLGLIHLVALLLADGFALGLQQLLQHAAHRRAQRPPSILEPEVRAKTERSLQRARARAR